MFTIARSEPIYEIAVGCTNQKMNDVVDRVLAVETEGKERIYRVVKILNCAAL